MEDAAIKGYADHDNIIARSGRGVIAKCMIDLGTAAG
jgi:hypothetical protein